MQIQRTTFPFDCHDFVFQWVAVAVAADTKQAGKRKMNAGAPTGLSAIEQMKYASFFSRSISSAAAN